MKRIVTFAMALLIMGSLSAQSVVEKTLVKPVNLKGFATTELHLNGEVQVERWANDYAQFEINIKVHGLNSQILKSLVAAGRYNVKVEYTDDKVILSTPGLAKAVTIRGNKLKDEVLFKVFMPEIVKV
ncbi:MAG: hypothetical protein ACPG5P_09235, partial [Saprospiraceae bacterium]